MGSVALVCAAGAALVVFATGRVWAQAAFAGSGSGHTSGMSDLTGADLSATGALGWAALAAMAAVFAVRGAARIAVGALLALLGAGTVLLALTATDASSARAALLGDSGTIVVGSTDAVTVAATAWPWLAAAGGLVIALAGLWTAVRGRAWPGMSARYERGARPAKAAAPDDPAALWKSLDRGEDPTADADADTEAPTAPR
ncbi:Trp biosynthesis-associated membrane protein [Actinocorallia herbida]|nr:Trp biosynthesis-associated membrane protein [Actinocorallia herbida]